MLVLVIISDTHDWGHKDVVKISLWKLVLELPIFEKEVYWPLTFKDEKTNFHPYFAFGQASFFLLFPKTRTGWLFYDAQEHPHPHVEAQALRMSITRLFRSIQNHKRSRTRLRSELGPGIEDAPEVHIFFRKYPLNNELPCEIPARLNQHPPAHHVGWMTCECETLFHHIHKS
jgi:hypothetical protein